MQFIQPLVKKVEFAMTEFCEQFWNNRSQNIVVLEPIHIPFNKLGKYILKGRNYVVFYNL